jgi:hypothetical protein
LLLKLALISLFRGDGLKFEYVCAARIVVTGHSRSSNSSNLHTSTTTNHPTARITITDLPSDRCVNTVVLTSEHALDDSKSPFWCSVSSSSTSAAAVSASVGFRFTQPSDCSRMRAALATCLNVQVKNQRKLCLKSQFDVPAALENGFRGEGQITSKQVRDQRTLRKFVLQFIRVSS